MQPLRSTEGIYLSIHNPGDVIYLNNNVVLYIQHTAQYLSACSKLSHSLLFHRYIGKDICLLLGRWEQI